MIGSFPVVTALPGYWFEGDEDHGELDIQDLFTKDCAVTENNRPHFVEGRVVMVRQTTPCGERLTKAVVTVRWEFADVCVDVYPYATWVVVKERDYEGPRAMPENPYATPWL